MTRFKRFREFKVNFDRLTLLVGTNSSGKTSVLQAVRLFFWCIRTCLRNEGGQLRFAKAVIPFSDFHLIPAHDLRELAFHGITPNRRQIGICLKGVLESGLSLSFRIYASYHTLMVIDPEDQLDQVLTEEKVSFIDRPPLYIPGFFGVVTKELLAHDARLEELLNSGHHNEVFRNIILRLMGSETRLSKLLRIVKDEFGIGGMDLPFSEKTTEFLRAEYIEHDMRIPLDFVSAGSGFLQVMQIMAHALQNPSPILLLDEPDAHMHHSLQRSFLKVLRTFADQEGLQVIMASHSETFMRETPLEEVRVIDASWTQAGNFPNAQELEQQLCEAGIWPTHLELAEILRTKRVLLVEGEDDADAFQRLGGIIYQDWDSRSRLLRVIFSKGSDESTVRRLEYVKNILGSVMPNGLKVAHLRDRDLLCDVAIETIRSEAKQKNLPIFITEFRNRESMLIRPEIVERALRKKYAERLPKELAEEGSIANLVHQIILSWCTDELDDLAVKIQEYNRNWIRRTYEHETLKEGEKQVTAFIRESWQEPIARQEIPWKLVDGKTLLRRLRHKLQDYKIMVPDSAILDVMSVEDFDASIKTAIELVYSWF